MLERLQDAVRRSRAGYTEIRFERSTVTTVGVRERRVLGASTFREAGGFVRCLSPGHGWGAASFPRLDDVERQVALAHELSRATHPVRPVTLSPAPVRDAHLQPTLPDDPRNVPLDDKRRLVAHLDGEMHAFDRRIADTWASYRDEVTEWWLVTSEGTAIFEVRPDVTLAVAATARQGGVVERAVESVGGRGGFGVVHAREEMVRSVARRAVSLLEATPVRSAILPVVLDPRLAGMLAHLTVGHLAEADAQRDDPLAASLAEPGRRLGSAVLTIGDDGSARGLRGTLPFDDEGTPTGNTLLMQHGVMVGRLHTRETAAAHGERATGNARATSWRHAPGARLTNPYIQNGSGTFQDLLRDIKLGVYACDLSGSVQQGVSAAFRAAHGYMIRDGELAELVKDVVLAGDIPELLGAVDRVAGDFRWHDAGGGCDRHGLAALPVSDGAPHIRLGSAEVRGRAP